LRPRLSLSIRAGLGAALAALALAVAACTGGAAAQSRWIERRALEARRTGSFEDPALNESSGVAVSRRRRGVFWSLNDSGNPASIFATDTTGSALGSFSVAGADNVDWEAISPGPCGKSDCLYIADTGDNLERRPSVVLYRVPEPSASRSTGAIARAENLVVRYPEGAHDVEAVFVDPAGAVHLIGKGWQGIVRHHRVPAAAWGKGEAVAERLDPLPIAAGSDPGRVVTDAALSPDGHRVAVRTYQEVFFFDLSPAGTVRPAGIVCGLGGLELQGEGIGWLDDSTLVLTGEGVLTIPGSISIARCPVG
jgi:hypothetical protein